MTRSSSACESPEPALRQVSRTIPRAGSLGRCVEEWCWVDAQQCAGVEAPSRSFYFGDRVNLTYSYETCSGASRAYAAAPRGFPP